MQSKGVEERTFYICEPVYIKEREKKTWFYLYEE